MKCILIAAGGTGGHIFPGLAVAEKLLAENQQVHWLGTADRMEASIVPQHQIPLHCITMRGVRGNGLSRKLLAPWMLCKAVWQAYQVMRKVKPDVFLGMGGYVCFPSGLAAKLLGIPVVLHEQNAIAGMTNKYLSFVAKKIFTGFSCKGLGSRQEVVGNPVRQAFFTIAPSQLQQPFKLLVIGGSLGAQAFNEWLPKVVTHLPPLHIVHQSGKGQQQVVEAAYRKSGQQVQVREFIDDINTEFAHADIIICRAGALTVAEVAAAGRAAIFVPYPHAVDDHQFANAQSLVKVGAALCLRQENITELETVLKQLLMDPARISRMSLAAKRCAKPDASRIISSAILELCA